MTPKSILIFVALGTALTGCQSTQSGSTLVADCDPQAHQALIGKNYGEVRLPEDLETRVISLGDVVTQEYRADRLNITVDPKGWIKSVRCG